jgi:nucleoside-diphosphate-sugar epimerase
MRSLPARGHKALGIDRLPSPFTHRTGSITDRGFVRECMAGIDAVLHTATLHKPHVETHPRQAFIDVNLSGTLNLLEEAAAAGVKAFVFTSTTSTFGRAMNPPAGAPAAWVTEALVPLPKNIYGVTKIAAENLCELVHRDTGLPCIVLRTSRFFPEGDDEPEAARAFEDANLKLVEFLHRRVDIEDVIEAHLRAIERAPARRCGGRAARADAGCRRELSPPGLAHAAGAGPRLRQRPRTRGARLAAGLGFRERARAARCRGRSPQRDGPADRRQGLSRRR